VPRGVGGMRCKASAVLNSIDPATPADFFASLASHWKRHYAGWTAWVLAPEMRLPSLMRLKESRRVPLWNGPIECRLFRFDMVAGSARSASAPPTADSP
jgi:putative N6-adenine-specific DNA methylase